MREFFLMCFEFLKTGLFSVGGGLATLPFLAEIAKKHPSWYTLTDLVDIVAISESTPGPIGINMSTFAGFKTFGVLGGIATTLSLVLPSFIIVIIVSRFWEKYKTNERVMKIFGALRAAAIGLISSVAVTVFLSAIFPGNADITLQTIAFEGKLQELISMFDYRCIILFAVLFGAMNIPKLKDVHPIAFILVAAGVGMVFGF